MSNIFSQAIDDIFKVDDFIETLTADGKAVDVSSYVGTTQEAYTEYGYDHGDSVSVACKCADWTPARGVKVTFRGREWKVSDYEADSHSLCFRVNLKSIETK